MAKLNEKPLKRSVDILLPNGLSHLEDILLEIDEHGVSFRVKGTQMKVKTGWTKILQGCKTPMNVPSFLMDKPVELLQHQINKKKPKQSKLPL